MNQEPTPTQPRNHSTTQPLVSVIMNCYNGEKYLRAAIDSVYAQTYRNWEIIFWDNKSTDKSPEIAKGYDDRIKYLRGEKNVKLYHARNLAISKATGEYVAFLDCDDMWLPDKLKRQVDIFEQIPETMFVFSNCFILNEVDQTTRVFLEKSESGYSSFEDNLYRYKVRILTAIVRRETISGLIEIFDERLNYAGDYDCFMRIIFNNLAYYISEPLAVRRSHDEAYSARIARSENITEILYVLDKLNNNIPDVKKKYFDAFRSIQKEMIYKKAYAYFMDGTAVKIRKEIRKYKYANLKFLALYLLYCIPYYLWILLKKVYKKVNA